LDGHVTLTSLGVPKRNLAFVSVSALATMPFKCLGVGGDPRSLGTWGGGRRECHECAHSLLPAGFDSAQSAEMDFAVSAVYTDSGNAGRAVDEHRELHRGDEHDEVLLVHGGGDGQVPALLRWELDRSVANGRQG